MSKTLFAMIVVAASALGACVGDRGKAPQTAPHHSADPQDCMTNHSCGI